MDYFNLGSSTNDFISRNAFAQNTESASARGGHSFVAGDIGVGALTEEEKQSLRESERKQVGSAP